MGTQTRIAFVIHLLGAMAGLFMAFSYLRSPTLMPHHLEVMGTTWDALTKGEQLQLISFMKSAATGFLTVSTAICIFLFIPFRRGANWARWAVLTTACLQVGLMEIQVIRTEMVSPGWSVVPFLVLNAVLFASTVVGFLLSAEMRDAAPR